MGRTETKQLWAVVCENLHVSFAPFKTKREADLYAKGMNEYSIRNAEDKGQDASTACQYRAVTMWIQVIDETPEGTVEYDRDAAEKKRGLN